MKKFMLPYSETGFFSKPVIDYLNGSDSLKPFYKYQPEISSFPKAIEHNSFSYRNELHRALIEQHDHLSYANILGKVRQNIDSLRNENTYTVTTAHQPNLFLGPLFLIYKIASTIRLASVLNSEFKQFHFVPVYVIGGEDHDKEELNHIHLFGKKIKWETDQRGAFGKMKTASLAPLIDEIKKILGDSEGAGYCYKLLKECYLEEETIADATRKILYQLFARDGLIILNGDHIGLKQLFRPVIQKELNEQFSSRLLSESDFTERYTSQISPREINLFYLDINIRERIVKEGDTFKVLNTPLSFSHQEILDLVNGHPENFSPNVVLRPLYQVTILPDVAFIGGGAEITYWMQIKSVFEAANLSFPIILLRNSALWIDRQAATRMDRLNISHLQIFQPADKLVKDFLFQQPDGLITLHAERQSINEQFDVALKRVSQVDPSLKGAAEAEKVKINKSLDMLEEKLRKAVKRREETSVQQILSLKEKLFPSNMLQERYDSFLPYYMQHKEQFLHELKSNLNPLQSEFTVFAED